MGFSVGRILPLEVMKKGAEAKEYEKDAALVSKSYDLKSKFKGAAVVNALAGEPFINSLPKPQIKKLINTINF